MSRGPWLVCTQGRSHGCHGLASQSRMRESHALGCKPSHFSSPFRAKSCQSPPIVFGYRATGVCGITNNRQTVGQMGEQPRPVDDEVERALVSMRAGFLSGSTQIAAGISALEEHLADAPDDERQAAHAVITQIVGTQARLTSKMEALPTVAWDRFKAMVGLVKAQQSLLDQLGDLMQKYVLPRQLENLSLTPLPESAAPAYTPPAPSYEATPQNESFMRVQHALHTLDGNRSKAARRSRRDDHGDEEPSPSLLA